MWMNPSSVETHENQVADEASSTYSATIAVT
jgi:hypothetical protein